MKNLLTGLLLLFVMAGCQADFASSHTTDNSVAVVATEIAVGSMQPDEVQRVPRSQCTVCGGTGKVKAGDTVTVVWHDCENCFDDSVGDSVGEASRCPCGTGCRCGDDCQCGPDCRCPPADVLAGGFNRRVLVFTAEWCGPCQEMKGDLLPWNQTQTREAPLTKLVSTGWIVNKEADAHFQLVDVDDHPEMMERFDFDSIPLCIAYVDGQEVARHKGPMDQWELGEFYESPVPEEPVVEEPVADVPAGDDPGAFINLGQLNDVQTKVEQLREVLTLLGGSGTVELRPDTAGRLDVPVSSSASIRLTTPCTVHYALNESGVITLRFDEPLPLRYRFLRGGITAVEISTEQVEVKIDGLPDGFFDIRS